MGKIEKKKWVKRIMTALLCLSLIVGNLDCVALAEGSSAESNGADETVEEYSANGTRITKRTTEWKDDTYRVYEDVEIGSRVVVTGDVILSLGEKKTLTCKKGITVSEGSTLTIEGHGVLIANGFAGNAGIGGADGKNTGTIIIKNGDISAYGGSYSAGIGSASGGTVEAIVISGGTVNASGGSLGAGIGSGSSGTVGSIEISGGTVNASGGNNGAGIGSGHSGTVGSLEIGNGKVTANGGIYGAGIGAGSDGKVENVTISGKCDVIANGGQDGAGIGSGKNGIVEVVTVKNGKVTANGGESAAGIGSGKYYAGSMTIIVDGGREIKATGEYYGAGIGGGNCDIVINGGYIDASSTKCGAGIGSGYDCGSVSVTINGGSVEASSEQGAGIGGASEGGAGTVTIKGGDITATSVFSPGIGAGMGGYGGSVILGWTSMDDSILSSGFDDTLSFMDGKRFLLEGTDVVATRENASGKRMVPLEGILYGVTSVVAAGNGSIVVDKNLAPPGQTVNVQLKTVYPADLDWVNATSENGAVQLENTGTLKYSFVMPACDVVINASFSDVSSVMITSPEGIMSYMPLLPQTFEYDSGWYVVMKDMTMSERMVIREGARLFLQGGTTLTCEGGISVNENCYLEIVGEGTLIAKGKGGAGIGGDSLRDGGDIRIEGGLITAIGDLDSAGIGGGQFAGAGTILITGGEITAKAVSGPAAAIGAGWSGGEITILGGKIKAIGEGEECTGIGGDGTTVCLGWTNESDQIEASGYKGNVTFEDGQFFVLKDTGEPATLANMGGHCIVPGSGDTYTVKSINVENGSFIGMGIEGDSLRSRLYNVPAGVRIRAQFQPVYPYELSGLTVKGEGGITTATRLDEYTFSFIMPNESVTISPVFTEMERISILTSEGRQACMPIKSYMDKESLVKAEGWYVLTDDLTFEENIVLGRQLKIYLMEGKTLNLKGGIRIGKGESLLIEGEGNLIADGSAADFTPGIASTGDLIIRGGNITAKGGFLSAGIGGDGYADPSITCKAITIEGGNVTAIGGKYAAGIGGGFRQDSEKITISGGKVTATGGENGSGIGSGYMGSGDGTILLGWTNEDDFIDATSYVGAVSFVEGKNFCIEDGVTLASPENLTGGRLKPAEIFTVTLRQNGVEILEDTIRGAKYQLPKCTVDGPEGTIFKAWSVTIGDAAPVLQNVGDEITMTANVVVTAIYMNREDAARAISIATAFKGKFQMNFYLYLPESLISDEGAYAMFTGGSADKKIALSSLTGTGTEDGIKYKLSYNVYAKEVRDKITLRLYYGNGDIVTIVSATGTKNYTATGIETSLLSYLDYCSGLSDEKTVALAEAAKNYCTAAQIYFDYKAEGLSFADELEAVTEETLSPYAAKITGTMPKGVSIDSISAVIEADNSFRLYLKYDGTVEPKKYKYYVNDTAVKLKSSGAKYYLEVKNVGSNHLDDDIKFTITRGTKSCDVTVSVLTYARSCLLYGEGNVIKLAQALYLYNQAATAKFGK